MTTDPAPVLDVTPGVMATVLPPLAPPVFLRLVRPTGTPVDAARRAYLAAARPDLRTCVPHWHDGAGVLVERVPTDRDRLAGEVHEVGRALRALADPGVARSYVTLSELHAAATPGAGPTTHGGG